MTYIATTLRHVTDLKFCIAQILRNKIRDAVRELYRPPEQLQFVISCMMFDEASFRLIAHGERAGSCYTQNAQ